MNKLTNIRKSKTLVLVVVTVALFLDALSITTIIPIIPNYLAKIEAPEEVRPKHNSSVLATSTSIDTNTLRINILFASKAFVQIIVAPFVGLLTNRIGYTVPMFCGFVVMFLSTLMFAFSRSYGTLFIGRALQGLGSSLSSITGLAMLATWYPDDRDRGHAMATAFGGTGVGVTLGPLFGGFFYSYFGMEVPFLILAVLALFDGFLRLCIVDTKPTAQLVKHTSLFTLFKDPFITLASGALFMSNVGIAVFEANLPERMKTIMNSDSVEQAFAFIPIALMFFIGSVVFGRLSYRFGRCQTSMIGLIFMGVALFAVPHAQSLLQLIAPLTVFGLTLAMVESSMLPFLAYLVDTRHTSVYGKVYSIADVAFCLAFFIGPLIEGTLINFVGFEIALYFLGALCILYAPILLFLRNPAREQEKQPLLYNK